LDLESPMSQIVLTIACAISLAQPLGPRGFPELESGTRVTVTTSQATITGTVQISAAGDFLQLQVADTTTPTYVRRSAIETLRVLPERPAAAREVALAQPEPNRHLVYVHGICRHSPGFSKPWWDAMKAYTPQITTDNVHEVVWSDIVNPAMAARMPASRVPPQVGPPPVRTDEQRRLAESVRAILRDRAEQAAAAGGAALPSGTPAPGGAPKHETDARAYLFSGATEAIECADDFVLYMTVPATREQILGRFDKVVRPLLASGAEVEIISHSWGTVIAYEGLRRLESDGSPTPRGTIHNLFTVGSALSIWPVRVNLAERFSGGEKPHRVTRWVNLDAQFDIVGGHIQGTSFEVDVERLNLAPIGCSFPVTPTCAHGSYFNGDNFVVNHDIFGMFIGQ
jgi:hypothetical protein